ncbi:PAS domain-containing protein [Aurantiacibacter sp. D1-12]|uniref:PAS domain-containing protein n=1 Tax=Aurantiacibacter sp. D1-12 TaxID=2993658 RepID=UPI00237C5EA1|nr:hypothetical protein [Aurantiacibacter sp. D1-12]MDE1468209.1 hypothetical protein [Aurantiacibacter sp. D1-12]
MDTLRGNFGPLDALDLDGFAAQVEEDDATEDAVDHTPPPAIGTDERRMQVRAYNFWASLLEDRNFPSVEDLDPTLLPDFGPNSVLLDFTDGIEDPSINFIGEELGRECITAAEELPKRLSEVPPRSLLSRITDHYMQILANQSPIGFEAEFVNASGATILYRGILLPFSSDDETIDFIYGVINWKEMADAKSADELLLEIDQALDIAADHGGEDELSNDLTDWADGPAASLSASITGAGASYPDEPADVRPSFDLSGQSDPVETVTAAETTESMGLADWLAAAREMALEARSSEERTRAALYEAVGRAWDFALAAADAPEDFAELLEDAGIATQERAPMTPVVKLVFGVDYDKTRLTEYAAVLSYAQRNGIAQGALGDYLKGADGGLKGVVAAERAFRKGQEAPADKPARTGPRNAIAKKLRAIEPRQLDEVSASGEEFALVMIRRTESGDVVLLGELPEDASLIEKAARKLIS